MEISPIPGSDALLPVSLNRIQGKVPTAVHGIGSVLAGGHSYRVYRPESLFYSAVIAGAGHWVGAVRVIRTL